MLHSEEHYILTNHSVVYSPTVRYRPCLGSTAHMTFRGLNTWWTSSSTDIARYAWPPRDVNGANDDMKKCSRGKGTILTASFRKSAFSWPTVSDRNQCPAVRVDGIPGKRRQVVIPDMVLAIRWLTERKFSIEVPWCPSSNYKRSIIVGTGIFSDRLQISYRASLSKQINMSVDSIWWWAASMALYGSTIDSDTWGDGKTV
jgi:hypothetical protein